MLTTSAPRIISARFHGVLDYAVGLLLIASPWLFRFSGDPVAAAVPVVMGGGAIFYSLFTRYPLSVYGVIPFNAHLVLDLLSGLFLVVSPWLCMFQNSVRWPHVVFGLLEIGVVILTGFRSAAAGDATPGHFADPANATGRARAVPVTASSGRPL